MTYYLIKYFIFPLTYIDYGKPLYDGALITEGVSYFLILRFLLKHKLTKAALSDILKLIELHCPRPNSCCKSAYFMKKFQNSTDHVGTLYNVHEYCTNCFVEINGTGSSCCTNCGTQVREASSKCEFITMSIEDQLRDLFKCTYYNIIMSLCKFGMYIAFLQLVHVLLGL